jgi:hypothetical protein
VINPDAPIEVPRTLFARRSEPVPTPHAEVREEPFHPRYVQLHALREHGHGPRNLAWGVVTILLALALVGVSIFLVGSKALLFLAVCLLTFTALFVLARLHVFRQRNGAFLALGIVCLFGAAMPLVELGYAALQDFARSRPIAQSVLANSPGSSGEASTLLLSEAFALNPPDPKAGPRVKVLKDTRVVIEGKPFLIKAGDLFALGANHGSEVTVAVRDLLVALPADGVEIITEKPSFKAGAAAARPAAPAPPAGAEGPGAARMAHTNAAGAPLEEAPAANETPAQVTARAQREVIRRYPALGVKDSLENQMFLTAFREIRDSGGDDFFANAEWPIELADLLAKREHWVRGAPPVTVSSGPASPIPEDEVVPR